MPDGKSPHTPDQKSLGIQLVVMVIGGLLVAAIVGGITAFFQFQERISTLEERVKYNAELKQDIKELKTELKHDIEKIRDNLNPLLLGELEKTAEKLLKGNAEKVIKEQFKKRIRYLSEQEILKKRMFEKTSPSPKLDPFASFRAFVEQFFSPDEQEYLHAAAR